MKTTGLAWLGGGTVWLVAGLLNGGTHESIWLVADALIAVGIFGLSRANLHSGRRLGAVGLVLAALGRASFVAAEIIAAISGNDDNALLPFGALATAVGMILYGIAVIRARTLELPKRVAPLVVGLYPFLGMFPIVVATGEPSGLAVSLWGVPIAALGAALVPRTVAAAPPVA
jgi:hypothetical protein